MRLTRARACWPPQQSNPDSLLVHHDTMMRTLILRLLGWPASARDRPRPLTRHSLGSASDCTHASASHAPRKTVPSAKRQTPWPCRLSSAQSPGSPAAAHCHVHAGCDISKPLLAT